MKKRLLMAAASLGLALGATCVSEAGGGRKVSGDHPYHNGYLFIPPSSAYEAVRVRPPVWMGAPAYYYPGSYMSGYSVYPPPVYPGVPVWRAGGYFMADYGPLYVYPRIR